MLMEGAVSTSCGHEFCSRCLLEFLETGGDPLNKLCPVCRTRIAYAHPAYGLRRLAADFGQDPRTDQQIEEQRFFDSRLPNGSEPTPQNQNASNRGLSRLLQREWDDLTRLLSLPVNNGTTLKAWILVILGFIYVISPIDLFPDWVLPGLGLLDDILICVWFIFLLRGLWNEYQRMFQY